MRLRDIHPEDFLRAGALFGRVGEQVADTIAQSRSCAEVRWVGRPNQLYQQRLRDLSNDLARVRTSFDDASQALVAYAGSLGVIRDLALQADLLEAQAHDLIQYRQRESWRDHQDGTDVSSVVALTPQEEALLDRARLLTAEAQEIEQAASRRVAARLNDLADHAMHVSGWQSVNRGVSHAAQGFSGVVTTNVTLAGDAFQALPGLGDDRSRTEARTELWAAGASMLQPWLMVEDLVQKLDDGQYAYAGGELAGALILKGRGGKKEALFGAHDDLPLEVLASLTGLKDVKGLASAEAFAVRTAQATFWEQVRKLAKQPAPTLSELLTNGVDLVQQEALGGHTIIKHVGRDLDFLAKRQRTESAHDGYTTAASSFASQEEAELLINRTLRRDVNQRRIAIWLADSTKTAALRLYGPSDGLGVLRDETGVSRATTYAIVEMKKKPDGSIFVLRSFLDTR